MHSPEVVVTDRAVFFDGQELPWYIAKDGISFTPGGSDDINRLTVEFLVGKTTFTDPWQTLYDERWDWMARNIDAEFWMELARLGRAFDVRG